MRITTDLISVITVDPTPGTEAHVELEGRNWAKLEAALAERKHSRLFEDRADVKLVGDDAVTYADFVQVIAIAGKVGFLEWRVMDQARELRDLEVPAQRTYMVARCRELPMSMRDQADTFLTRA